MQLRKCWVGKGIGVHRCTQLTPRGTGPGLEVELQLGSGDCLGGSGFTLVLSTPESVLGNQRAGVCSQGSGRVTHTCVPGRW